MEGPSLVIACEEFAPYFGLKIKAIEGTAKLPWAKLKDKKLLNARSFGKHFLLEFENMNLRIHFLMFGSYRIDDPRENRIPKMQIDIGESRIYFYSCAIRILEEEIDEIYDWSIDTMSKEWDSKKALKKVKDRPNEKVCDIMMDQDVFAGVGNIIKNEVLFRLKLHPDQPLGTLSASEQKAVVKETHDYCHQFYTWKKAGVLKRNWQIFRKRKCPLCETPVTKKPTGKLKRLSHFCKKHQKLRKAV